MTFFICKNAQTLEEVELIERDSDSESDAASEEDQLLSPSKSVKMHRGQNRPILNQRAKTRLVAVPSSLSQFQIS